MFVAWGGVTPGSVCSKVAGDPELEGVPAVGTIEVRLVPAGPLGAEPRDVAVVEGVAPRPRLLDIISWKVPLYMFIQCNDKWQVVRCCCLNVLYHRQSRTKCCIRRPGRVSRGSSAPPHPRCWPHKMIIMHTEVICALTSQPPYIWHSSTASAQVWVTSENRYLWPAWTFCTSDDNWNVSSMQCIFAYLTFQVLPVRNTSSLNNFYW